MHHQATGIFRAIEKCLSVSNGMNARMGRMEWWLWHEIPAGGNVGYRSRNWVHCGDVLAQVHDLGIHARKRFGEVQASRVYRNHSHIGPRAQHAARTFLQKLSAYRRSKARKLSGYQRVGGFL